MERERAGRLNTLYEHMWQVHSASFGVLDESLLPRSWNYLFDLAASWGVAPSWSVLDAGCGRGNHSLELTQRFGCTVTGIDVVLDPLVQADRAQKLSEPPDRIRYLCASVDQLPFADALFDMVWCRDMLVHVPDLTATLQEFARVLKPGGMALLFVTLATDLLEPRERESICAPLEISASSLSSEMFDQAFRDSGFRVAFHEILGSELIEYYEERDGRASRELMRLARMRRRREELVREWGERRYETAAAVYRWVIYQLLGKLSSAIYRVDRI